MNTEIICPDCKEIMSVKYDRIGESRESEVTISYLKCENCGYEKHEK